MRKLSGLFIFCLLFVTINSCMAQAQTTKLITVENLDKEVVDAISKDDFTYIRKSIKQGLNVNTRDKGGLTYLDKAVFCGATKTMVVLLEAGAPVNSTNNDGVTALNFLCTSIPYLATLRNSTPSVRQYIPEITPDTAIEMIVILLKYHADPNIACDSGSPLHSIAGHGIPEICELLLNAGANINLCIKNRDTPLFMAVVFRNINNVRYLIKKGADVNLGEKCSPLIFTAVKNDLEIGKMLIEAGADVNSVSVVGGTALSYARKYGYLEFEKMLLANGAH